MRLLSTAVLSLTAATAFAAAGLAQTTPAPAARPAAPAAAAKPPAAPAGPAWAAGCQAASRTAPLNCGMEQRLGVQQTGQLIAAMGIQVPATTRKPTMILQLPLGMNLSQGATLQIDANPALKIPIQSCDQSGCVAVMAIPDATLAQMMTAKAMNLTVMNAANKPIKVPFTMTGFATTFNAIK